MKFGIKLWSTNFELINLVRKHYEKGDFDYIELSAIVNSCNKEIINLLKGIPCIIHIDNKDVNLAQDIENNDLALKEAIQFANKLNANYIIIHPGWNGNINKINDYLSKYNDSRFCIENMPGVTFDTQKEMFGRNLEELKQLNFNHFCFDFAHAIKASNTLKINQDELINDLIKLNPKIIHISDGFEESEIDEHLSIGEGNFNFNKIKGIIRKFPNIYITLETPKKSFDSLDDDVRNVKKNNRFILIKDFL